MLSLYANRGLSDNLCFSYKNSFLFYSSAEAQINKTVEFFFFLRYPTNCPYLMTNSLVRIHAHVNTEFFHIYSLLSNHFVFRYYHAF